MTKPKYQRLFTSEGEKEFGHIFKHGRVPLTQQTPIYAKLGGAGDNERVFLVDWKQLTAKQQSQIIEYMSEKFSDTPAHIRVKIEQMGHFPIRSKYVIESYSMRYFY